MPDLEPFRISKSICNRLLAIQCLNYLQFKDFDRWPTHDERERNRMKRRNEEHPFYKYAAIGWLVYARHEWTDPRLTSSAKSLFNPVMTGNFTLWALQLLTLLYPKGISADDVRCDGIMWFAAKLTHSTFTPLHMAATLSIPVVCSILLKDGAAVDQKSIFGTPLQCAAQGIYLGRGAERLFLNEFRTQDYYQDRVLEGEPQSPKADTINCLLRAGAKHNMPCSGLFSGLSLIGISLQAEIFHCGSCLLPTIVLFESGVEPHEKDLLHFEQLCRDRWVGIRIDQINLKGFIETLSPMIEKSTTHFKLCQAAWSLVMKSGHDFDLDPSIVDTRISLSKDAILEILFVSIRHAKHRELASVLKDPRIDLTGAVNPANGKSPFEEAARILEDGDRLSVFKMLLDAGCSVTRPGSDGLWPVHALAQASKQIDDESYDSVCDIIREFVRKGTGCTVLTEGGQNVLHLGCSAPVFIRAFLESETEENVTVALEMQDKEGYTPFSFALAQEEEESALLLLQRGKRNCNALRSPIPLLPLCVRMTAGFLQRLMSLYPEACTFRVDGKLPLDVYLNSRLCFSGSESKKEVLGILATTTSRELNMEEKSQVWENLTSSIQEARGQRTSRKYEKKWVMEAQSKFLERAVQNPDLISFMQSYEVVRKVSAVSTLLEPYGRTLQRLDDLWPISLAAIQELLNQTSSDNWKCLQDSAMAVRLLEAAIKDDHIEIVTLLLTKGVSVHHRVDQLSALELACDWPATKDSSRTIFTLLLDHADTSRLNEINPNPGRQKGLIHHVAGRSKEWQILELLKRDADPNLRTGDNLMEPALVYHLWRRDFISARVLLEKGANPNQTMSVGVDAALSAARWGATSFLSELSASTTWKVDWQKTCTLFCTLRGKRRQFCGQNALHIAAGNGHIGCLAFYIDNNLLTDVNITCAELFTPMHFAAMSGRINSIAFLLDKGADINAKASDGSLPLHLAVQNAHVKAVNYLVDHGSIMDTNNSGMSPMAYARQVGNQEIIECLGSCSTVFTSAAHHDTEGMAQAFEDAFLHADMQTCEELLRQGFCLDSELPSPNGYTPLVWAIDQCRDTALGWLLARDVNVTRCASTVKRYISPLQYMVERPKLNKSLPVMLDKYQRDGGLILREKHNVICAAVRRKNNDGLRLLLDHVHKFEAPHR